MRAETIEADLTWTGERFERGVRVSIGEDGRIASVERASESSGGEPVRRLERRALLPGFVNAHSHAFQRGLRGRGETFPAGAGSFWSWREAMYVLVDSLDAERFHALSLQAFREMRAAGITTVGEFHYLHHLSFPHLSAEPDFTADRLVLDAAREAGIRIVLLQAAYRRGGFDDRPLEGGQRRFDTLSLDHFWRQLDALGEPLDPSTQSLGVVAHSTRAVEIGEIVELHRGARERGLALHLHVEEQTREIEDCRAATGRGPLELLLEHGVVGPEVTIVHATHSTRDDLERWLGEGGNVCLCPLTEANLGDGIADLGSMLEFAAIDQLSLGTDSNARISMLEEMRWLEYVQRARHGRRGVVLDAEGRVGRPLLHVATRGGARALGLGEASGRIAPGAFADLVAVDLDHPSLAFAGSENDAEHDAENTDLLDALACGAADGAVDSVCVGGRW